MPLAEKPFKASPKVELLRRECLSFEDAAHILENGVGPRKRSLDLMEGILDSHEEVDTGSASISYHNVELAAQSLREDWTTWPKQLRLKRSPFYLVTGRLEVNLHPMYLGNLSVGLRSAGANLLHRWVVELKCILLGFKEIKPAGKLGAVVSTSPFVHFYMDFTAVGFAPKKGDWLMGRLCKYQIQAGMNITLVGLVNCHIPAHLLPSGLRFCKKTKRWLDVREGLPDNEKGEVQGEEHQQVYVQMLRNILVDKYQQSGKTFEFQACLGWPTEKMPKKLKKAQRAEEEDALDKAKKEKDISAKVKKEEEPSAKAKAKGQEKVNGKKKKKA